MRVAALFDIHANLPALEAVVARMRDVGINLIVVGGDVVPGPMVRETLALLRSAGAPCVFIRRQRRDRDPCGSCGPRTDSRSRELSRCDRMERGRVVGGGDVDGRVVAAHGARRGAWPGHGALLPCDAARRQRTVHQADPDREAAADLFSDRSGCRRVRSYTHAVRPAGGKRARRQRRQRRDALWQDRRRLAADWARDRVSTHGLRSGGCRRTDSGDRLPTGGVRRERGAQPKVGGGDGGVVRAGGAGGR